GPTPARGVPTITLPSVPPPAATAAAGLTTARITARVVQGARPVAGMRVILLTALDTILGQQVTADDGTVAFDMQIATGTRVDLAIPALGMRVPVDAAAPDLIVALPAEAP
ncbi:hypothetical protein K2Z83_28540, partial [Oscillochloris sp. ZM17-4]|uniref:hypothetical protein n=1 Tax=Oscillochloris sp. ZM17-4 TaxID=2866714 RepID=UPI001C73DC5A